MAISGGCLCGAVRYSSEGAPIFMAHCYCSDRRQSSATGHGSVFGLPQPAVQFTGDLKQYTKRSDHESDVTRSFCPNCGSGIHSASSGMPGVPIMSG